MQNAKLFTLAAILLTAGIPATTAAEKKTDDAKSDTPANIHAFTVKDIDGNDVKLDRYAGKVCLIVNVASRCGLTERNYRELEPLFKKYKDQGLCVLAFPANNFMGQEPGSNAEIKSFCARKYNVTFDLFEKVSVKGKDICPLYKYLTTHPDSEIAGDVKWNFQKYLVDREGQVIAKFGPRTNPQDKKLIAKLEAELAKGVEKSKSDSREG
jgi:glutathione peroxidase-family protein